MIEFVDNFQPNECTEFFEVDHKTGLGVGVSLHGDDKVEVVAMPVVVGAGSEYLKVLFPRPRRIVQLVCCVKVFLAADVYHAANIH